MSMSGYALRTLPLLALMIVAGCAAMPADRGIDGVERIVQRAASNTAALPRRDATPVVDESEVTRMLAFPLSIEDAERLALYRNPLVMAKLDQVGVAAADVAQAGRLANPGFSYTRFGGNEYEATTLFDLGGLLLMPLRRGIARRDLEIAQYRAAVDVLDHLRSTRDAWINAVAESQRTALMAESVDAMDTANQLVRQMAAIGHYGRREAVESEIRLAEMRAELSRQRVREYAARENLVRRLGVFGSDASLVTLPATLESVPQSPADYGAAAVKAVANRLDVEIARQNIAATAERLRLTRRTPFLNVLELGPVVEAADGERETGFELELVLPLFDLGGVRNERARVLYQRAVAQAESVALTAASEARESLHAYRRTHDIALAYRDRLLPLRERLTDEEMLRYNGMLISVFDLLDDARRALALQVGYVDALRDFWLADNRMKHVLVAGGGEMELTTGPGMSVADTGAAGH